MGDGPEIPPENAEFFARHRRHRLLPRATVQGDRERRYLDGALAGGRYLQAIAKTEGDICLIRTTSLTASTSIYLGWCHGPAGTARLWYQLAKTTSDKAWMEWVHQVRARAADERHPRSAHARLLEQREPVLRIGRRGAVLSRSLHGVTKDRDVSRSSRRR